MFRWNPVYIEDVPEEILQRINCEENYSEAYWKKFYFNMQLLKSGMDGCDMSDLRTYYDTEEKDEILYAKYQIERWYYVHGVGLFEKGDWAKPFIKIGMGHTDNLCSQFICTLISTLPGRYGCDEDGAVFIEIYAPDEYFDWATNKVIELEWKRVHEEEN